MLEGLWSIELGIRETDMQGAGVVVFENQRVLGGSSDYFYTGRYEVKEGFVQGEVEVKFYGRNVSSIFKFLKKFRVRFSGKVRRGVMRLENYVVEDPKKEIFVRLSKRAEIQ